jgi:hypothetical protein
VADFVVEPDAASTVDRVRLKAMPGPFRLAAAAAVVVAITLLGATAASTAAGSPKQRLRDAAVGTWSGEDSTLAFRADGTATFTVKACGYQPLRPGFVKVDLACASDVVTGQLRVEASGYALRQADGSQYNFGAYADGRRLFLYPGATVTLLTRARRGTVHLGGSETLLVGDGQCTYSSAFLQQPLKRSCRFVRRGGRTILLYTAPDPFAGGKVRQNALVYLPRLHLLVSPELLEKPFTRSSP